MATRQEVLSKVRAKYPQYENVDDDKLASALSEKYPAYRKSLANWTPPETLKDPNLSRTEQVMGGEILDPETGERSQEQLEEVRHNQLGEARSRGAKAQREIERAEDVSKTTPLESAYMGAAKVPAGFAALGGIGITKLLERGGIEGQLLAEKQKRLLSESMQEFDERSSVNPVSGALGQSGGVMATSGGAGGVTESLAKQAYKEAGKRYLPAAAISVGSGAGIRAATGQGTTANDLLLDIVMAGVGGRRGTAPSIREAIPSAGEETFETMVKKTQERKLLDEAMRNRMAGVETALPVKSAQDVAARETATAPRSTLGFSPVEKPKNIAQLTVESAKESVDDLLGGTNEKLAMSAIKPSVHAGSNVRENLSKVWIPKTYEAAKKNGIKLDSWDNVEEASRLAVADTWNKIDNALDAAGKSGAEVSVEKFNNQVQRKILSNKAFELESKAIPQRKSQAAEIDALIESYQGAKLTPQDAEDVLQTQNALLESYYNKAQLKAEGMTVEKLAKKDPVMATRLLLAEQLRSQLDEVVSNLPGEFSGLKREYGTLSSIVPMIAKRKVTEERQQLLSLQEKMTLGQTAGTKGFMGALDLAAGRVLSGAMKKGDSGVEKLKRAFYQHEESLKRVR